MDPPATSKVLRAPSLKRGQENVKIQDRIKLERVLGVTVSSNAALDCDATSELVAYPAGCTVVLFNPRKNTQAHVLNGCRKTVTSLALAGDGRLLATGECGHMPNVRVWDISDPYNAVQIAEFSGHKYGINCVAFSPSNKYVVSVGSQHDMIVNVWDWRNNVKVASNKVSSKVKAVCFAENGNYFVTVGNRHVKFWYLEYSRSAKYKEPVPLMGRSAILGEQRNNDFVDVACGRGEMADSTYAITKTGLLCEFNNRRLLDKWVELRTTSANCMAVGDKYIFIGCAEGIVRCFSPSSLQFITTLPRTHYLGVDVAQGLSISHMSQHPGNARYPDAIALAFDEQNNKLTCVYNDHSIYVWDVRDIRRVGKSHSFLYHSACIWGVEMYPTGTDSVGSMPPGSFVTCSSDDTIRVWNLEKDVSPTDTLYKRNIYSNELLKVLYIDPELTYLKDLDLAAAGSTEKSDASYDGRNGVRSIRIGPDGKHLASGDRSGNIRIHDLSSLEELCLIEAHDAEVLCLEYSKFSRYSEDSPRLLASASRDRLIHVFSVDQGYNFLQTLDDHSSSITAVRFFNQSSQANQIQMVSCGADKSIIFRQLQSTPGGMPQFARGHNAQGKTTLYDMEVDSGQKHVLTACQDRNIRVYNVSTGKHSKTFKGSVSEDGSLIKVVLDASGIYVATSCTDKTLCVYDYYSGECMATMLGHSELVTGLRFSPDCRNLVSASGDGCIFVWRVPRDMVVTMQARLAQQAMRAGKRPPQMNGTGIDIQLDNENFGSPPPEFLDPNANPTPSNASVDYRFSVGQLPLWAKKQINTVNTDETGILGTNARPVGVDLPKGRWAQRVQQGDGITVKSVYDSDEIIPFPPPRGAIDSDGGGGGGGSKDSSIDSGTETKCSSDYRRETIVIKREEDETVFQPCPDSYRELADDTKQVIGGNVTVTRGSNITELTRLSRSRHHTDDSSLGSFKFEDHESTEHDGDVEDYSEGENGTTGSEKSHHRLMYYPAPEDTVSNQFTVNAMDVEELRRSQRRQKKPRNGESGRTSELTASGSQDDSDSEGGASTPSAERNPLSILSEASSEGFDQLVKQSHREKYLKNAFESLSGAEEPTNRCQKTTSISSQFHGRLSGGGDSTSNHKVRNVAVMNATKQARGDADVAKKREELQRRIEETRRKLQSVGYKSSLKTSQSISDLSSHIPEKHHRSNRLNTGNNKFGQQTQYSKPINPCKPIPNPKPPLKSQQLVNKASGVGNALPKLDNPTENRLSKSQTTSCISEKARPTSLGRPLTLTLKKTEKYKLSLNKPNQSLPESPVCEELKLLKEQCKKNVSRFARFAQKRRSCSYFIGLDDNEEDMENIAKSFESLPAMNERNIENFHDTIDDGDDGNGNFSDDSLEGDFKNPPRRCVSDYQINVRVDDQQDNRRPYANYQTFPKRILTGSQESILSDASVESFSKGSAEILDYGNYDNDRHSSASFFLSRRKIQAGRSQESILTDESDYQMFPLQENMDHRSTESVLTDDSDSLVKSAPLEMLFDSHYKRKRQNSETYSGNPNNVAEPSNEIQHSASDATTCRAVFRSKSLQDTRISKTTNENSYPEDGAQPATCIYYEFNFNDRNDANVEMRIGTKSDTISRSNSLKVSKEPQSMLILNDFVAHKPPKPKRNSARTQSMRNRARPAWNKYNVEPTHQSTRLKSPEPDDYASKSRVDSRPGRNDEDAKHERPEILHSSKRIEQLLQSSNYSLQSNNDKDAKNKFYSLQTRRPDKMSVYDSGGPMDNYGFDPDDSSHRGCDMTEGQRDSSSHVCCFENQIPTKDTQETYDSLEAGCAPRESQSVGMQNDSDSRSANEPIDNLDVDLRITRAIEGTVKLLSKEFENLVRREQYFMKEKCMRLTHCQEAENFAKLEAERDGRFGMKRDIRFHSGGDDSDFADTSAMDRSMLESGSSTSASSCTNSPKRMWPPASRCQSHMKWTKTLPTINQAILPSKHLYTVSGKVGNKNTNASARSGLGSANSGNQSRHASAKNHSSHMTRSSSVGVLNQSDSESDVGVGNGRGWNNQTGSNRISGLMRPTISSQNKINHQIKTSSSSNSNLPSVLRRRGMQGAYSSVNLSQVGNQEDSSSEDTSSNGNGGKPALPPRPRSISIDHSVATLSLPGTTVRRSGSTTVIANGRNGNGTIGQNASSRISAANRNQLDPSPQELPVKDTDRAIDVASAELGTDKTLVSTQLCNTIADDLTRTADNVVQLYKRLTIDKEDEGTSIDRDTMLRGLQSSVNETMRTLRLVVASGQAHNDGSVTSNENVVVNEATATFQELLAGQDQGKVVNMMQQYSELLLTMMQQRMEGTQSSHT
ncbi:mitogen-activated protein kinase-binding protein 1 isoform X1 [Hylaeus volcanicus]|uniref:mitogen-activated protein kinase-binding protein 1 isoform X1 n=1 Tax=Hylaeus volcanicus TaxID=313075 RepID=UPI0023B7B210|nr:mitogen-activated protein kinase-binding protein 1 isoform X1 [Hylaeus volcanicus]XP_053971939.1 mitogen-activated protein kinase-binding protein 1 isoform X1 [Hylaeus volcanicus]